MIVDNLHISVLKKEVVENLDIKPNEKYIDATIGAGGHTEEILQKQGIVLGIDQNQQALDYCTEKLSKYINNKRLVLVQGNFENIVSIAQNNNFNNVLGVLYDLGISSMELEDESRGFSFKNGNAPLDMRLSNNLNVTAYNLLNALDEKQLLKIFIEFGQVKLAKKLVLEIVKFRKQKQFYLVSDLVNICLKLPYEEDILPKVFLALRIAVNSEIESLKKSLSEVYSVLKTGGKLAIISFNSLEDKISKKLKQESNHYMQVVTPIIPLRNEILENPKSRSAKLRIYEKI